MISHSMQTCCQWNFGLIVGDTQISCTTNLEMLVCSQIMNSIPEDLPYDIPWTSYGIAGLESSKLFGQNHNFVSSICEHKIIHLVNLWFAWALTALATRSSNFQRRWLHSLCDTPIWYFGLGPRPGSWETTVSFSAHCIEHLNFIS